MSWLRLTRFFTTSKFSSRTHVVEAIIQQRDHLVGVGLKPLQGIAEVRGIDASLFAEAPLHLVRRYDARGQFFVKQGRCIFHDLRSALAHLLEVVRRPRSSDCGCVFPWAVWSVRFGFWHWFLPATFAACGRQVALPRVMQVSYYNQPPRSQQHPKCAYVTIADGCERVILSGS